MAKKGMVEREKKRQNLVAKFSDKRNALKMELKETDSFEKKHKIYESLQKLPLNSMKIRLRNRCFVTGKSRGFYRDFGLSRNMLRSMGHQCLIPGLVKASW